MLTIMVTEAMVEMPPVSIGAKKMTVKCDGSSIVSVAVAVTTAAAAAVEGAPEEVMAIAEVSRMMSCFWCFGLACSLVACGVGKRRNKFVHSDSPACRNNRFLKKGKAFNV
jgi:hypothetical protein